MNSTSDSKALRQSVYGIIIVLIAGLVFSKILAVTRLYEPYLGTWPANRPKPMATLGDNDRSRWATIRALGDNGTYVIGHRDVSRASPQNKYGDSGIISEDGWKTIDKVLRPDTQDFYSSKPPLLPTILAGEYILLKNVFGWNIVDPHGEVIRVILLTVNWVPMLVYLVFLARMVEELGTTDWGRIYVFSAGCFGTFLFPFSITLNNHSVATCTALLALYFSFNLCSPFANNSGPKIALNLVLTGLFAGFTACTELPATSLAVALFIIHLIRFPKPALFYFLPGALVPVLGFFLTNYLSLGQWAPAYSEFGGPWYQYDGSHWSIGQTAKTGIDFLDEPKYVYAFHLLFGHHGLFSLTPIFLLSIGGMFLASKQLISDLRLNRTTGKRGIRRLLCESSASTIVGTLTLLLTVTVVSFYVYKTHNYGGWNTGPRWLIWLTPLLLLCMVPIGDKLANLKWGRMLAYLFLGWSVASVCYPPWNPWRPPWISDYLEYQNWLKY